MLIRASSPSNLLLLMIVVNLLVFVLCFSLALRFLGQTQNNNKNTNDRNLICRCSKSFRGRLGWTFQGIYIGVTDPTCSTTRNYEIVIYIEGCSTFKLFTLLHSLLSFVKPSTALNCDGNPLKSDSLCIYEYLQQSHPTIFRLR